MRLLVLKCKYSENTSHDCGLIDTKGVQTEAPDVVPISQNPPVEVRMTEKQKQEENCSNGYCLLSTFTPFTVQCEGRGPLIGTRQLLDWLCASTDGLKIDFYHLSKISKKQLAGQGHKNHR